MIYNIIIAVSLAIIFIVCLINNYLKNKIIKGYMHSLNQSETKFVRERRLKEEFYDRYISLKTQMDKINDDPVKIPQALKNLIDKPEE